MTIKSIKNIKKLVGKKVLLRADFNVPVRISDIGYRISDILNDYKIRQQLPTIRFLLKHKCKIIIITHLGRPSKNTKTQKYPVKSLRFHGAGKNTKIYSVKPIAAYLGKLLKKRVKFVDDCVGFKVGTAVSKMKEGQILMLENLRFHKGEESNNKRFAKELAGLADMYINDAFAVSHRAHASVSVIKNYLPAYAGFLLEKEVINLNKVLNPKRPLILIIGGAKVATKLPLIKKLHKKAFRILIGGALANNFLSAHNLETGKSVIDRKSVAFAKNISKRKIILPVDLAVSGRKNGGYAVIRKVNKVRKNDYIYDIGPETIRLYAGFIRKAKTIIWNGPLGFFEVKNFKHGTLSLARLIAARSTGRAFGVVGGGETVEALKMTKMMEYVDWVSTGGGAMLAYLGGGKMPGLSKIVK